MTPPEPRIADGSRWIRHDAAVFFGRDAEIVHGLDILRGMRQKGVESMLVIQGPSGAGKSAFLRAGLLPRLYKDDRRFLPMEVVRPEREVLSGERGLAKVHREAVHLPRHRRPGAGRHQGGMPGQGRRTPVGMARCGSPDRANAAAGPGSLASPHRRWCCPLDQAEELFSTSTNEGGFVPDDCCRIPRASRWRRSGDALLVVTIRADSYEPLHTAPQLAQVASISFNDLKQMPKWQFERGDHRPCRARHQGRPTFGDRAGTQRQVARRLRHCRCAAAARPHLGAAVLRIRSRRRSDLWPNTCGWGASNTLCRRRSTKSSAMTRS